MNRFACYLYEESFSEEHLVDDNCVIGYDEPMQTFFFQSGEEDEEGAPLIWLGIEFQQYQSISQIEKALQQHKFVLKIDLKDREILERHEF